MKTITILSALAFTVFMALAVVKLALYTAKRFGPRWRELEEWFRRDE